MFYRNAVLPCLFLLSFHVCAIEQVVTLSSSGKSDHQLRAQAKNQALLQSLDKLPAIIWGSESFNNDMLVEQIQTIGYAHADVAILNESFDHQQQRYTLIADVRFDEAKIGKVLKEVADGQFAIRTLEKISDIVKGVEIQRFIDSGHQPSLPPYVEAKLFTNPYFYAQTHSEFIEVHEGLIQQFTDLLIQQNQIYLSQFAVELSKITKTHFTYRLTGPELPKQLLLTSTELQQLYNDYADEIEARAGGVCLFSPLVNKFFSLPNYSGRLELTLRVNQEFARVSYADHLYRQEMKALEFTYCDGQTKSAALNLRTAHPFFMEKAD